MDLRGATRAGDRRASAALPPSWRCAQQEPGVLVAARIANAGGVVIGYGEGELFIASDLPAIVAHTQRVVFLDDGEIAAVTGDGATYIRAERRSRSTSEPQDVPLDPVSAARASTSTSWPRRSRSSPKPILDTIRGTRRVRPPGRPPARTSASTIAEIAPLDARRADRHGHEHARCDGRPRVHRAAGRAAGRGRQRFRVPLPRRHHRRAARSSSLSASPAKPSTCWRRCTKAQAAGREAGHGLQHAGLAGDAHRRRHRLHALRPGDRRGQSTKTFLARSIARSTCWPATLGARRGFLDDGALGRAPRRPGAHAAALGEALKSTRRRGRSRSSSRAREHFLFLGRGLQFPVAMEGALKLKEVSYIHAEGYAAGEMKHGPIALIDDECRWWRSPRRTSTTTRCSATSRRCGPARASSSPSRRRRRGPREQGRRRASTSRTRPTCYPPLVTVDPLQFLAYHIARLRGCDIDQPRNLAKTVTVE